MWLPNILVIIKSHFYLAAEMWFSLYVTIAKTIISNNEMIVKIAFAKIDRIKKCKSISSSIQTTSLSFVEFEMATTFCSPYFFAYYIRFSNKSQ